MSGRADHAGGGFHDGWAYLGEDLHLSLDLVSGDRLRASLKNANAARGCAPAQAVEIVIEAADLRLLRR